jgi:gamma-glutamyltranspeptidase/glutathione hydrolase
LTSFDGRETAPSGANENLFLDENREPLTYAQAVNNGNSVGVPGLLKALEMMHKKHGKLPWKDLFQPTIELAEKGFQISPRLFKLIQSDPFLRQSEQAKKYFYDQYGNPRTVGTVLKNPELAYILREISIKGITAFYEGKIAKDMVSAVSSHPKPGKLVIDDLKSYEAKERLVICGSYRSWKICGMGPPSSGGITTLQILGILEKEKLSELEPNSAPAIHLFSEAGRLAFADRDLYIADPDFVKVPFQEMLDPFYLSQRRNLIDISRSMGTAKAGGLPSQKVKLEEDKSIEIPSTSHISIVDKEGNAISMTLSVAAAFGSRIMVNGFFLNNEMTDFSFLPEKDGKSVLNKVQANKRPRSAMSPTFVFDQNNKLSMVIGSAGGPAIINYVAKAIIGVVDWHLDIQSAVALPNFGSRNQETDIEMNRIPRNTILQLEKMNHSIKEWEMTSGTNAIVVDEFGRLWGGVDPRREGLAIGH